MRRIHRQFGLELSVDTEHLYNGNDMVSIHACPLLPVAWTPTLLGMGGDFVRGLRNPVADSSSAVRQCKSHTLYLFLWQLPCQLIVLHDQPGSSNSYDASQPMDLRALTRGLIATHASLSRNGR